MRDAQSPNDLPEGGLALVIGAQGGIGAALLSALDASGQFASVQGWGRSTTPALDLLDENSIRACAQTLSPDGPPLRLVIDATGFLHKAPWSPEKSWQQLDPQHMAHSFAVNAIGPALLMKHLLPLLARDGKSVFATLSAKVGSIGDNRLGGWYSYRASKAALNMLVKTASIEVARTHPQAVLVALHPGTVNSALSAPFNGAEIGRPAADAAADMLQVLDGLPVEETGGFYAYSGENLPW